MRVARWRWVLLPMLVLVAGCLPHASTPDLPPSLLQAFGPTPPTLTILPPPDGTSAQEVVSHLRPNMGEPMFDGRAVPYFVGVDCHGNPQCSTAALGAPGGRESVWVVLYPDCTGPDGDIGWVMVDVDEREYSQNTPCHN